MKWVLGCLLCVGVAFATFTFVAPHKLPNHIAEPLGLRGNIADIRAHQTPLLTEALAQRGLRFGDPVYIRIFKEEAELEMWVQDTDTYQLFKTWPICNFSGDLGPKLAEGDRQSPEGFYNVGREALNPQSRFHLSFNLGFPNSFDRAHDRTGSFLMVHGDCASIGCYAMTDPAIEEIYVLLEAALNAGQPVVPVHAFPFRMTDERLEKSAGSPWFGFWSNLKDGYSIFENTRIPAQIDVMGTDYVVREARPD